MTTEIIKPNSIGLQWNNYISPGVVGSIGGVNQQIRFKQSNPDMRMRYDPLSSHKNEMKFGSNVQDGMTVNYDTGGGPASVIDTNWYGRRDFKTSVGWRFENVKEDERLLEPTVGETPGFSWTNRVATVYKERHANPNFLPLPGGYSLPRGEIPANGGGPVLTNVVRPLAYAADVPIETGAHYTNEEQYEGGRREVRLENAAHIRQQYLLGNAPQRYRGLTRK